jgi:hypothetical protein
MAAIRAYYGDGYFAGRSVLALGVSEEVGDLVTLGARVVCARDARRCPLAPGLWRDDRGDDVRSSDAIVDVDLDRAWPFERFDLVLHLGLLPSLDATHASLRHACAHGTNLVVETAVCDSNDPELLVCPAVNSSSPGMLSSPESRVSSSAAPQLRRDRPSPGLIYPSPARIERTLTEEGMLFQRLADSRCNGNPRLYDWLAANTGLVTSGQHRLWFARRG